MNKEKEKKKVMHSCNQNSVSDSIKGDVVSIGFWLSTKWARYYRGIYGIGLINNYGWIMHIDHKEHKLTKGK